MIHDESGEFSPSMAVTGESVEAEQREPSSLPGGVWALFLGLGLLMVGNGLNGAVIGIRSASEGFSVTVTGVIMAGYFAGFLVAPSLVVRMIPSVGHIRVFAGLASTASSVVLIHAIAVFPASWTLMRFVFGFCMSGLYVVIESWLGEMTTVVNRGRTLAVYMIVSMMGLGLGQLLITSADPNSFQLFVVSSVLVSMSLVPVTLAATTKAPAVAVPEPVSVRDLVRLVPTGVLSSLMSGASAGIMFGLASVYATSIGLSIDRTAVFLLAPMIGAVVFQFPIGRVSDRVSRRAVIFAVAATGATLALVLRALPEQSVLVPVMMVGLGGMLFPLYSLVVSYTLDWTEDTKIVGTSGTLVRINGAGALLGPLVTAPMMSRFGADWFYLALAAVFGVVVTYVGYRLVAKDALPMERQKSFVPFPARASYAATALIVKPVRKVSQIAASRSVSSRRHPHQPAAERPSEGAGSEVS
ncbi:MAG: MFS transporter [Ilumatobacter sp.]